MNRTTATVAPGRWVAPVLSIVGLLIVTFITISLLGNNVPFIGGSKGNNNGTGNGNGDAPADAIGVSVGRGMACAPAVATSRISSWSDSKPPNARLVSRATTSSRSPSWTVSAISERPKAMPSRTSRSRLRVSWL